MSAEEDPGYRQTIEEPRAFNPRGKLLTKGAKALSDVELLTVLLGGRQRSALRLIRRHGLAGLPRLGPTAFRRQDGIGSSSTARLLAVCELARRTYGESAAERPRLGRPQDVFRQVKHLAGLKKEHLVGLYLDAQNGLLHQETISIGSLNTTRTHPREILHPAIVHLALGFILAHNHPSGCLEPSPEDLEFTRSVARAGEIVGIELYDHLIVAGGKFTSLRERGLL